MLLMLLTYKWYYKFIFEPGVLSGHGWTVRCFITAGRTDRHGAHAGTSELSRGLLAAFLLRYVP